MWITHTKNSAERNRLVQSDRWPSFSWISLAMLVFNPLHLSPWGQRWREEEMRWWRVCVCVCIHKTCFIEVENFFLQPTNNFSFISGHTQVCILIRLTCDLKALWSTETERIALVWANTRSRASGGGPIMPPTTAAAPWNSWFSGGISSHVMGAGGLILGHCSRLFHLPSYWNRVKCVFLGRRCDRLPLVPACDTVERTDRKISCPAGMCWQKCVSFSLKPTFHTGWQHWYVLKHWRVDRWGGGLSAA